MARNIVKLKDIASRLGVSTNTVSRALRDASDISESLKIKIKKLAKEMGYIPNNLSNYIREGDSHLVGIVIPSFSNPYFSLINNGVIYKLQNEDYYPLIFVCKDNLFTYDLLKKMIANNACAILTYTEVDPEVFKYCKSYNMPLLSVGVTPLNKEIDAIFADDYHSGKIAAEEFNKSERRRPCYINSDVESVNKFRRRGFLENVKAEQVDEYFIKFSERDEEIPEILNKIITRGNDFIYSFNDEIALYLIETLNNANYKDYDIIGTDGIPAFFDYSIKFSTIGYSFEKLANIVEKTLMEKIKRITNDTIQFKYKSSIFKF